MGPAGLFVELLKKPPAAFPAFAVANLWLREGRSLLGGLNVLVACTPRPSRCLRPCWMAFLNSPFVSRGCGTAVNAASRCGHLREILYHQGRPVAIVELRGQNRGALRKAWKGSDGLPRRIVHGGKRKSNKISDGLSAERRTVSVPRI